MKRLRSQHSPERLQEIYARPHSSELFDDHKVRVDSTVALGCFMMLHYDPWQPKIADLSCGDAKIVTGIRPTHMNLIKEDSEDVYLGDYAPGYPLQGPIEETIGHIPDVSLFVLSETLEHLDSPLDVLLAIRAKTEMLLLSTPIDEPHTSGNEQHLWSWGVEDVEHMLRTAGFNPVAQTVLRLPTYYDFQIWGCL